MDSFDELIEKQQKIKSIIYQGSFRSSIHMETIDILLNDTFGDDFKQYNFRYNILDISFLKPLVLNKLHLLIIEFMIETYNYHFENFDEYISYVIENLEGEYYEDTRFTRSLEFVNFIKDIYERFKIFLKDYNFYIFHNINDYKLILIEVSQ